MSELRLWVLDQIYLDTLLGLAVLLLFNFFKAAIREIRRPKKGGE